MASILQDLVPDQWQYEQPLTIGDATKYPDFTITTNAGLEVVWEHLGMMSNPKYAKEWAAKKDWYRANGYRPYDEPAIAGERGVLVWTDDMGGVDQPAWAQLAGSVFGPASPKTAAKKAPAKRA